MGTLFKQSDRDAIVRRIDRLTEDGHPLWGRFTAPEMVSHLIAAFQEAMGRGDGAPGKGPLARQPLQWLVIHVLPWPKGKAQAPANLLARKPGSWAADVAALRDAVRRLAERDPGGEWPSSGFFGRLSGKSWGALLYKHCDHHLRQFGV